MHLQHLWIWEGAIPILIILVEIMLSILTKKIDDNKIPKYKGLEEYLRSETPPVTDSADSMAVDSASGPLSQSSDLAPGKPLRLPEVLHRVAYSDIHDGIET